MPRTQAAWAQVKGMKEAKQQLLRLIEELRAENGNLQELVGFLTESADLAAHQSDDYADVLHDHLGSDDELHEHLAQAHLAHEHLALEHYEEDNYDD